MYQELFSSGLGVTSGSKLSESGVCSPYEWSLGRGLPRFSHKIVSQN